MARYKYKAQNANGKKMSGVMNAIDETDLHHKLREKQMFLLSCKEMQSTHGVKQLKPKVLADFSRQLATLVGSGVTLVRALSIIASGDSVKPKHKAIYNDLLAKIRQGISLSDAMRDSQGAFPPLMIYMFRSAETSGNLDQVAMKMAELFEKDHKLKAKISSSMTYPKILSVMIVGVIIVLTKMVMPQFEEMFAEMEELPKSTAILMGFSDVFSEYWYLFLAGGVLLYVGTKLALTVPSIRIKWHWLKIHAPVFGKLQKVICTSRFSRTMSSLYTAGIPIVQSLQIARKTIGNDYIDSQFDEVITYVRQGNNLSDGLDKIDGFVKKLTDSIRVGEETGKLDTMLLSISDSMEYDADMAITKMVSYVEPCMLLVMGIIIAFVISAVFSAIYGSYDALSGM